MKVSVGKQHRREVELDRPDPCAVGKRHLGQLVAVPPEAIAYIDEHRAGRPRTVFLREVLAKGEPLGDVTLNPVAGAERVARTA